MEERLDAALVAEAKEDPRRFEALYNKYAQKVYNFFFHRLKGHQEIAEDLTQETFLKAFEHLPRFRTRGYSYLTYLLTIARNLLINYYKKHKDLPLDSVVDPENIPDKRKSKAVGSDKMDILWHAIYELSLQERDILLLRYHKDLSIREVAHVIGKSENATTLALSRIRKKLRSFPSLQVLRHQEVKLNIESQPFQKPARKQ